MENIKFIELSDYKANASLVAFLSQYEYKFEPINFYDRERFYCLIKGMGDSYIVQKIKKLMRKLGFSIEDKFYFCPLVLTCSCIELENDVPVVFTREEVMNIITDVPEKYIGENRI